MDPRQAPEGSPSPGDPDPELAPVLERIANRFGVVPSFFTLADPAPDVVRALFGLAEFAYLDSPIPSLFKERLFTYLSRFCQVPYCMTRHCGFLTERGRVAGDPSQEGIPVAAALEMLSRPLPDLEDEGRHLLLLRSLDGPLDEWPEPGSPAEASIFATSALLFAQPLAHTELVAELRRVLGPERYTFLALFLSFIRFAHFWTEAHPELRLEPDLEALLAEQRQLAGWVARYRDQVAGELERQVEAELERLERIVGEAGSLEEADRALAEELRETRRRMREFREASQAKSRFLNTISHELRTPLNAIIGYVDLLQQGVIAPLPTELEESVERIRVNARLQQDLVDRLLQFGEAGRQPLLLTPVDLPALLQEVAAGPRDSARARGVGFHVHVDRTAETVRTDRSKLTEILHQLLRNAVTFTAEGEVRVRALLEEDVLVVRVEDTGPGLPDERPERVFTPLWQEDQSPGRRTDGTGIGLALARRYAEMLGGTLEARPRTPRGSVFELRLPLLPSH